MAEALTIINWQGPSSVPQLPEFKHDLETSGIYLWRVHLPNYAGHQYSYYTGMSDRGTVAGRISSHIMYCLGLHYWHRADDDRSIDSFEDGWFWGRLREFEHHVDESVQLLKRSTFYWAGLSQDLARQAEGSVYLRLEEINVLLDQERAPVAAPNIRYAFKNVGAPEVVGLLGEVLDYRPTL